jgi:hypothetical protein
VFLPPYYNTAPSWMGRNEWTLHFCSLKLTSLTSMMALDVQNFDHSLLTLPRPAYILKSLRGHRFAGNFGGTEAREIRKDRLGFLFVRALQQTSPLEQPS